MSQLIQETTTAPRPSADRDKALKILAKSIYKELKLQGFDHKQVVAVAGELIAQVTSDLQSDR